MGKRYMKKVKADKYRLYLGNSRKVLKDLPADFVHSVVCDPPYGLSFMGKKWDHEVPSPKLWAEVYRVMKPGAYLIAFFGTRTYHRGVCAIEDAGFEIRDQIAWLYGSGFPKSRDLSKDMDKIEGVERKVVGKTKTNDIRGGSFNHKDKGKSTRVEINKTVATSDLAKEWQGWGSALKPAMEPIVLARKPLGKGNALASNAIEHGVGGINIDGCRIGVEERYNPPAGNKAGGNSLNMSKVGMPIDAEGTTALGRWPANIIHDGSDEVTSKFSDGSDRFFYCAKASKADRDEGMEFSATKSMGGKGNGLQRVCSVCGSNILKGCDCPGRTYVHTESRKNHHPTVKPTDLMAYLCRLVTPKDGIVLDPFMGSGSTGKAAMKEDFRFIGVEMDPDYFEVAHTRVAHAAKKYAIRRKSLFKASM